MIKTLNFKFHLDPNCKPYDIKIPMRNRGTVLDIDTKDDFTR